MAPSKRQKKAASKPATTTRSTRARSKEVAAPPPPAIAPSRRSTRATSNEPLLQLADPNKILRKARKTPEVQVAPSTSDKEATTQEPPTPSIDGYDDEAEYTQTQETQQDVPSSPTPTVIVSHEVVEYDMANAPASPTPARFKVETDFEVEAEVEAALDVYVDDVAAQNSSPFQELPGRKSPSPDAYEVASAYSGFQSRELSPINEETTSEIAHFFSPPAQSVQHVMSSTEKKDVMPSTEKDERNISYSNYYHQIFTHLRQLLANDPPRVEEALQVIDEQRDLHEPAPITSSPPNAAIRQASPTSSVFHTPSEPEKPASGGFLSALVSPFRRIATPVSRISRLLGRGAQTQPVQKTSAAPATTKAQASTPTYTRSHAPSPDTPSGAMSPYLSGYLSRQNPQASPSLNHTSHGKHQRGSDSNDAADFAPVTPSQQRFTATPADDGHLSGGASTLYLPDGRPIPKEFRNWIGHTRARQQRDMELVHRRDLEVASGDRVLTKEEQGFKEQTEFRQLCLEQWRARQPGNRLKVEQASAQTPQQQTTTPMAGRKRGNAEIRETTEVDESTPRKVQRNEKTPDTSRRRVLTPVGVTAPIPGHPEYRHVNEERPFSASATNSPEPTHATRGWSVTVPDESDDDEEMTPAPAPARAASVPINPPNWIGIPEDFYDSSSSDEEDTDMESPPTAAPTTAAAADAIPAFGQSASGAPPATPYAHKYTPHKPSGLRAVETMASSPIPIGTNALGNVITPPHSPDVPAEFGEILGRYLQQNPAAAGELGAGVEIECEELVGKVVEGYKGLFERRGGVVA